MTGKTLIEKLEALKDRTPIRSDAPFHQYSKAGTNTAVDQAIAIVRQHQAQQPQEVVEQVKGILRQHFPDNTQKNCLLVARGVYDAAAADLLAVMKDGIATVAPVAGETDSPPAPASDGWIDWRGGECPVSPDTVVEVVYRDSPEVIEGPFLASEASELWDGQNDGDDIIRYRIVREGAAP